MEKNNLKGNKEEKQDLTEETSENINWVEEVKKGKKSTEIEILETSINGVPDLRLCRVDLYKSRWGSKPLFTIVTVDWYRRSWGCFHDAGIFFKSVHTIGWERIGIVSWFNNDLEVFLKKFPETREIFRDYPRIPRKWVKIEFLSDGEHKVAEGYAFFDDDGEHVLVDDYEGNKWRLEAWTIDSIQETEGKVIEL